MTEKTGGVNCYGNQLTSLDVSNLSDLLFLTCGGNQLSSLDISNNPGLGLNTHWETTLDIRNMPTLYEVCVWTTPFPPEGMQVNTDGSPNVYFTTECSK